MSLDTLLQNIYNWPISDAIRANVSAFPMIESLHVLALTIVFGTILIVDLRLIGVASHRRSARLLIVELLPYTWVAFALAVVTGGLLFTSNALSYAHNPQFLWKMAAIVAAGINMAIFHMTAYRRIVDWDDALPPPTVARVAGLSSLTLWVLVIFLGRWIGFTLETIF